MIITYHGEGCFKIQSGSIVVVSDPLNDRMKPDVLLKTAVPFPQETGGSEVIAGPGEYEIQGVEIRGTQLYKESSEKLIKTAYLVTFEEIRLGFLGEAFQMPEPEVLEMLSGAEILFLPIGGKPYLDAETASKIVKQIKPAIVIPSHFKNPKEFFEEMGQKPEVQEKLTIKKKELIELGESTKVICLKV